MVLQLNSWDRENAKMFSRWGLAELDEMEDVHQPAMRFLIDFLASRFLTNMERPESHPANRILDVGTGSGHFITKFIARYPEAINSMEFIGLDISEEMVKASNARFRDFVENSGLDPREKKISKERVLFLQCNILDIDEALGNFNAITSVESIYYVSDMEGALKKLYGSLREGGMLILAMERDMVKSDDDHVNKERITLMKDVISVDRIHFLKLSEYISMLEAVGFTSIKKLAKEGFHYLIALKGPR